jgi:NADH-quinone oxidoreductase subunit A
MAQYLPLVVLCVLAIVFGAVSVLMSKLLAPSRPSAAKSAPYECGIVPSREPPERFPVSFYVVAMLFVMFDIEIIFVYPYAVTRGVFGDNDLATFAFWEMVAFSAVFFVAFVYVVARGALDWGPLQFGRRVSDDMVNPERTSTTTIRRASNVRRVGLDGRGDEQAA